MKPCPNSKCNRGLIPRKPDCDTGSDKKCPDCGGKGEVEEVFKVSGKRRKVNVRIVKRYRGKPRLVLEDD